MEMQGQGPSHMLHLPSVSESWEGGFEDWASCFITITTLIVAVFNRGCPSDAHQEPGSVFDTFQYEPYFIFTGTPGGSDYVILILH